MTPVTYDFETQLAIGATGEERLDAFFARWYRITAAPKEAQRAGIDRYFAQHATPARRFAIEYKTDSLAAKTRNVFIETVSVSGLKRGWAYTSRADFLIYFIPERQRVIVVDMLTLRSKIADWLLLYRSVTVQNTTYQTHGVLVPLAAFEAIALRVYTLTETRPWPQASGA